MICLYQPSTANVHITWPTARRYVRFQLARMHLDTCAFAKCRADTGSQVVKGKLLHFLAASPPKMGYFRKKTVRDAYFCTHFPDIDRRATVAFEPASVWLSRDVNIRRRRPLLQSCTLLGSYGQYPSMFWFRLNGRYRLLPVAFFFFFF